MIDRKDSILVIRKRNDDDTETMTQKDSTTTSSGVRSSSSVDQLLDSYGCVICPSTPPCPSCGVNEQCSMSTQTCNKCPTTFCETIVDEIPSKNALSSAQVGGIAGGISGLFFIVVVAGLFFLFKRYKKRMDVDYELGIGEEMKGLGQFGTNFDDNDPKQSRGYNSRNGQSKRLSQSSLSTMTNSVLTKASNVLNIAYVPGVTSRPTKPPSFMSRRSRKPGSIYSKTNSMISKETYFSDLENASINVGKVATKGGNLTSINVNHDEYDFDNEEDDDYYEEYELDSNNNFDNRYKEKETTKNDGDSETESSHIPLDIGFQLPGRRNVNEDIIEETEDFGDGLIELVEEESDGDDNGDGVVENPEVTDTSNRNQRTMPTRYAELVEKKDQVKPLATEANPFSSRYAINNKIGAAGFSSTGASPSDSGSDAYSDSDSDEENIEFLLQQSAQTPHGTQTSIATRSSHKTSTLGNSKNSTMKGGNTGSSHNFENVNPFADA